MTLTRTELNNVLSEAGDLPVYVYVGFNRYKVGNKISCVKDEYTLIELTVDDIDNDPDYIEEYYDENSTA
jgi:hypothetical protein